MPTYSSCVWVFEWDKIKCIRVQHKVVCINTIGNHTPFKVLRTLIKLITSFPVPNGFMCSPFRPKCSLRILLLFNEAYSTIRKHVVYGFRSVLSLFIIIPINEST